MSEEEIEGGKNWIIKKTYEIAGEFHVPIEGLTWDELVELPDQWSLPNQWSLAIVAGGKRKVMKFKETELADCLSTREVQLDLEKDLKKFLKSLCPQEK